MKKLEKKFSFILPIHNGETFLEECLNSVLNQNYDNYDVIVIINRCTDNTVKIIRKFVKKYDRIKVFHSKSSKVGLARNLGIKKSKCDYFICIDSDDIVSKDMLKTLNDLVGKNDYDLLRFNASTNHTDKKLFNLEKPSCCYLNMDYLYEVIDSFIKYGKINGPMWLYAINKNYFVNNKFRFVNKLQEDFGIFFYLIYNAKYIYYVNKELYFYRINNDGIMLNPANQISKLKDTLFFCNLYLKFFKNKICYEQIKLYLIKLLINKYKKTSYENKKRFIKLIGSSDLYELQSIFNNSII